MARQADTVGAIGFSVRTSRPASNATCAIEWWAPAVATISTMAKSGKAATASSSDRKSRGRTPNSSRASSATKPARLGSGSTTATNCAAGLEVLQHSVGAQMPAAHAPASRENQLVGTRHSLSIASII